MFTGIIEAVANVEEKNSSGMVLARPQSFQDLQIGQSIAVNGACLSVVEFTDGTMRFDVVPETFQRTNLSDAKIVNLERALSVNGRFEGHIVSGHVDTTVQLLGRTREGEGERFSFEVPEEFEMFLVEKGSVTLNGVALTVASVSKDRFEIAVIPHTLEITNLRVLNPGDRVNFEVDILAKYLQKWAVSSK